MPQAASAHDTFWDFVSLMPESAHMQMWVMSDRAIPRSYRMMQGFGVHTFRMINERGESVFVKFHWNPIAGTHSLDWDEAVKISRRRSRLSSPRSVGSHRGRRVSRNGSSDCRSSPKSRPRSSASTCSTPPRSCPRNWCRCSPWAAWCSTAIPTTSSPRPSRWRSARRTSCRGSISPTIRCSRGASTRTWTRRSRGWAGLTSTRSRSTRRWRRSTTTSATACIARRSIAAVCRTSRTRSAAAARSRPGARGFTSFPEPIDEDKVRGKPEKFADHYTQAALFYQQPDADRAGAHRACVPVRAHQGAGAGDPRACGLAARERGRGSGAQGRRGLGHPRAESAAGRATAQSQAGSESSPAAVVDGAAG